MSYPKNIILMCMALLCTSFLFGQQRVRNITYQKEDSTHIIADIGITLQAIPGQFYRDKQKDYVYWGAEDGSLVGPISVQADLSEYIDSLTFDDPWIIGWSSGTAVDSADLSSLSGGGTDDQTLSLVGTDLSIEDGNTVDLSSVQDGTGTDDQDLTLVGNTLAIENDPNTDVDLSGYLDNTDDQELSLVGTDLSIEDGNTVDLSTIQDGTGTDDQNLSFDPKAGTDVTLNIQDGVDVTFREGANITLNRSGSNLMEISAAGDGTGTDDQDLTLVGNTLAIENDPNTDVDLSGYLDNTDDQELSLVGTDLSIEDGNTVDLSAVQDGTGTDDQTLSLVGTDLSIEDGNTVDLATLEDPNTIHSDQADEYSAATQKVSPSNADRILIEDSGASWAKKWIRIDSLPNAGGGGAADGVATSGTHNQVTKKLDITVAAPGSNFSIDVSALAELARVLDSLSNIRSDMSDDQDLTLVGNTLAIENDPNTDVDLSGYLDNTDDQTLSLVGTDLSIEDGNMVDLSTIQDGTGSDDQDLTLVGNTLAIENDPNTDVDLSGYLDNTDDQELSLVGTDLSIEDGNTVDLSTIQDGTGTDDQDLTLVGNTLAIENDPNTDVDLSGYLDNTDDQELSLVGTDLSIEDGNTVDLSAVQDGTGTDDQDLTLVGNTLAIENDPNTDVDLSGYLDNTDDQTLSLVGTDLSIEDGNTVDLSTIQDGTGTDDQNLSFDPKAGTDVTLNIQDGVDVTFREGANITLNRSGSNLMEISAAGDGTGTDNQDLSVTGDSIKITNGSGVHWDDLADDFDEHVTAEEGKAYDIVDKVLIAGPGVLLQKSVGGLVTSDHSISVNVFDQSADNETQYLDTAQLVGNELRLSLSLDSMPYKAIDLSSLGGGGGGTAVDTLEDYDALRSYAGSSDVVYVQDFTVSYGGDDYLTVGGFFVNVPGSDENGATLIGGWQRVFDRTTYLINWYEVDGYDHTGTDNSVDGDVDRFNSMIKLASSAGGGTVTCLPLTYDVDVSGLFSSVRIGVSMESNIDLDLNGAALQPPDGLLDGSWKFEVIHGYTVDNVEIRNGTIRGNTAGQSWSTYQQNGISTGIAFHSEPDSLSSNIRLIDLDVDDFFGNSIWFQSGSLTTYEARFTDVFLENVRCHEYGEGPDFIGVQNLNVTNLYLDPGTVNVGDHLEMSKCQDITITDYVNVGGSGSGSGIDFYGNRRAIVNGAQISNVHDIIEIHRDSDGIYPTQITVNNVVGRDSLEKFAHAIEFSGDQSGTRDIYFNNIQLRKFYRGFVFQTDDGVGGPIVIDGFQIDSCLQGIMMTSSTDLTIKNGTIRDCTNDGILWNSYLNDDFSATDVFLRIEDVDIYDNGGNGLYLNLLNASTTYTLNGWVDVNAYDNFYTDILFTEPDPDDHPFVIRNENPVKVATLTSSVQAAAGVSDFYPIGSDLQRLQQAYDGQRIRVHGKSGGVDIVAAAYDYSFVLLDGSSSATLDEFEYMDFFFDASSARWYETGRSNVGELVDVGALFDPDEIWGGFTDNRLIFWSGTDFAQDLDLSYISDVLKAPTIAATTSFEIGAGGTPNGFFDINGSYVEYTINSPGAGLNINDNTGSPVFQVRDDGDVRIYGGLKDNINSVGTSGQVPISNGSGWTWGTPAGGGDVSKVGTPAVNQIGVWTGSTTIRGYSGFEYDGSTFEVINSASNLMNLSSSGTVADFTLSTLNDTYTFQNTSTGLHFKKGGITYMTMDDDGDLAVGTTSTPYRFHVQGDALIYQLRDSDGDLPGVGEVPIGIAGQLWDWGTPAGGGGGDGYATSGTYDADDQEIDIDMAGASDFPIDVSSFSTPLVMAKCFQASNSVDFGVSSWTSLASDIDNFLWSYGIGNDTISVSNGVMTVPYDGIYEITIHVNCDVNNSTKNFEIAVGLNGTSVNVGETQKDRRGGTWENGSNLSIKVKLDANDTVQPMGREWSGTAAGALNLDDTNNGAFTVQLLKKL